MWLLLFLFLLRVVGQALVAFLDVSFLPPMERWYSGLIPYPWLLLSQVLIILVYAKVCIDFTRGNGIFVAPRRTLGLGCLALGAVYLGVMLTRYGIRMGLYPGERWTGGSIPTFFHWVLAAFLILFGAHHWVNTRRDRTVGLPRPSAGRQGRRTLALAGFFLIALAVVIWVGSRLAHLPPPEAG